VNRMSYPVRSQLSPNLSHASGFRARRCSARLWTLPEYQFHRGFGGCAASMRSARAPSATSAATRSRTRAKSGKR
jgi:hypothetical protein